MELVTATLSEIKPMGFTDFCSLWSSCLNIVQSKVSEQDFSTWLEPIIPIEFENNVLVLQVHNKFFSDWVEERFGKHLISALHTITGNDISIEFRIKKEYISETFDEEKKNSSLNLELPFENIQKKILVPATPLNQNYFQPNSAVHFPPIPVTLNPKFIFENYINGDSNKLAYAAALAVANNPGGTEFNPLVIYGGVGLGKTHLIQAIGNHALAHGKAKRVRYTNSEEFMRNFIESIQLKKPSEFTNFYHTLDLLIVDDIQFFASGEKTQDSFFHIFNGLYNLGKQIILSCDRPLNEIKGINERLISRFQMALTVDIQPPDLEMRIAILHKKSEAFGFLLPQDVAEIIAQNITSNIRQLEGCLTSLVARVSLENQKISIELAKDVLRTIVGNIRSYITIQDIQKAVSNFYNIPEDLLGAKTRKQEIVMARQVAMYLAKELTNTTYQSIGQHFGGRDHSTVLYAYQQIADLMNTNEQAKNTINQIRLRLQTSEKH